MSGRAQVVALAVAGLAVAVLLGFAASLLASDTIALPATSLAEGETLAPPTTTTTTRPATTTSRTTTTTTTESTPSGKSVDIVGDDGSGRCRVRRSSCGDDD